MPQNLNKAILYLQGKSIYYHDNKTVTNNDESI